MTALNDKTGDKDDKTIVREYFNATGFDRNPASQERLSHSISVPAIEP
jgi:hypothetical protein